MRFRARALTHPAFQKFLHDKTEAAGTSGSCRALTFMHSSTTALDSHFHNRKFEKRANRETCVPPGLCGNGAPSMRLTKLYEKG